MSKMSYRDHNRKLTGLLRSSLKARLRVLPGDFQECIPDSADLGTALNLCAQLEILWRTRVNCPAAPLLARLAPPEAFRLQAQLGRPLCDQQTGPTLWVAPIETAACRGTTASPTRS